jgi:hypothetical protein
MTIRQTSYRPWAIALAAFTLLIGGAARAAATPPVPGLAVDPTYGPPLTTIKVTGQGFCSSCGPVQIQIANVGVDSSDLTWNPDGTFTAFVRVPGSARPGDDPVVAKQTPVTARTTFTVTTSVPAPTSYPTPSSTQPPGGLPPQASTTQPPAVQPTPGSSTTSPGSLPPAGATSTTVSVAASSASAIHHSRSSNSDHSALIAFLIAIGLVGAAGAAGGTVLYRRHRHS